LLAAAQAPGLVDANLPWAGKLCIPNFLFALVKGFSGLVLRTATFSIFSFIETEKNVALKIQFFRHG
jgi:hypothetical protein